VDTKHILFADDDEAPRDLFRDAVNEWNEANQPRQFVADYASTVEDAQAKLKLTRFDCALFDLRLPSIGGGKPLPAGGNDLAQAGLQDSGVPVAIITATVDDVDRDRPGHGLLEAFYKGAGTPYADALSWFADQWDLMDTLASVRGRMRVSGAETFVRRIWPSWQDYKRKLGTEDQLTAVVTRQYATHIAELLGMDGDANPAWHPFENFISPALLEHRAHTGDIFTFGEQLWVVLSPQCDMTVGKIDDVLLAYCDRAGLQNWTEKVAALSAVPPGQALSSSLAKYFTGLVNQTEPSKHFLPPLGPGGPLYVDFKKLMTKPLADLNSEAGLATRVGSVAPAFLPNLTQRFGSYMSRPGQPNIDISHFADP